MSENSVYLGQDGILRIICVGDQDEASARQMAQQMLATAKAAPGQIKVLFDATRAGKFSVEARQIAARSLAAAMGGKAAIVASSAPMRALGLFLAGRQNARNMRFFDTRKEALSWLSQGEGDKRWGISFQRLWRALSRVRWLRIKERWLKEVFEVLQSVAMGDFSRRLTVSRHQDELALIEAGINLMADDLEDREKEAKEYQRRLREERNRLARELHDSLSQLLFSVVLNSESASALVESDPQLARARIESVRAAASEAKEQMRDLLTELRFGVQEQGLTAALSMYVTAFQGREGIETTFSVKGQRLVAASTEREIFRIAQEALNNIAKHSQATSAAVELGFLPGLVRLRVEDNGIGFDPSASGKPGLGLTNMRERAEGLGGWLEIDSTPGKGTRVTVEVPLEQHHG